MAERDETKLPVWAQQEIANLRERAESAESRLRGAIEPDGQQLEGVWCLELLQGLDETLLRLPVSESRMRFRSPLGFHLSVSVASRGLLHFNCAGGRRSKRERIVAVPRSSNVIELGAVSMFGGEVDGE